MPLYALGDAIPAVPSPGRYWIAPDATVIGRVTLGENVGIWFGAVLRGDNEPITVGADSNVQEHAVVHTDPGYPVTMGVGCTVGHRAILHGCTLGDHVLAGMGATILNGAVIGNDCLIGAGALVPENRVIPAGSLVVGLPAKVIRALEPAEIARLRRSAETYVANARRFADGLKRIDLE